MSKSSEPDILLDSDVIRHFINAGQLMTLAKVFPGRLVMLDKVKAELCRSKGIEQAVNNFLAFNKIAVLPFPVVREILIEYATLKRTFGEGESACMAVARHQRQFIASSNLKDIKSYCELHKITYITTMAILEVALSKGIFSEIDCDSFIAQVLAKGSKLPCKTMKEYFEKVIRK